MYLCPLKRFTHCQSARVRVYINAIDIVKDKTFFWIALIMHLNFISKAYRNRKCSQIGTFKYLVKSDDKFSWTFKNRNCEFICVALLKVSYIQ